METIGIVVVGLAFALMAAKTLFEALPLLGELENLVSPGRLVQGIGVLVALASFGFQLEGGAVTYIMWRDNPTLAALLVASGAFIWKFTGWLERLILDNDPSVTRLGGPVIGAGVVIPKTETPLNQWVGKSAVTLTTLRPIGRIEIDKLRLEAMSQTGFLDAGVPVRITGVQGNALLVQPAIVREESLTPQSDPATPGDQPVA